MFWPFTVWGFLKPNFEPHEYWISRIRCCNSTYRLRYWNKWSWKATSSDSSCNSTYRLRYWNLVTSKPELSIQVFVATVLTVYGIETFVTIFFIKTLRCNSTYRLRYWNKRSFLIHDTIEQVATVLTVYGIETSNFSSRKLRISLQQYLPFTVLKLIIINSTNICALIRLQQYLPFTVLKQWLNYLTTLNQTKVATVLTVYGIETLKIMESLTIFCCNSTYRLRYWNQYIGMDVLW